MAKDLPEPDSARRSQRWMRFFVNDQPAILNHAIRQATGIAKKTEIN